jgi:mRNA-degrading endonuclease YafQ of YafQ-DinJ toxin-antitoxin module
LIGCLPMRKIYRTPNDEVLQLVRLGSHSELGL